MKKLVEVAKLKPLTEAYTLQGDLTVAQCDLQAHAKSLKDWIALQKLVREKVGRLVEELEEVIQFRNNRKPRQS